MAFAPHALGLALAALAFTAQAQDAPYPNQPIKLIVPFTAGSSSDVTARAIAQKIGATLGQPVVVDNRPGANGGIGMQAVARSKPDGYTLAVGTVSTTVVPPLISKNVPYDLFKDFVPVATMANTPLLLTVVNDSPFNSVQDLVAAAKKAPKTLTYGNSAGLYRIAMEAFNHQAGVDLLGIPFKGPAQAATEVLAGRLSVNPDALGAAGHVAGQAHARPGGDGLTAHPGAARCAHHAGTGLQELRFQRLAGHPGAHRHACAHH